MPLIATSGNASARAYGSGSSMPPEILGGMVLMTPTSITSTGSGNSSSITSNGSVTFSSCETVSLNGVFTVDYENYVIYVRGNNSSAADVNFRYRASGTDNTSSGYTSQYLQSSGGTISANRTTTTYAQAGFWGSTQRAGMALYVYRPFLSRFTLSRSNGMQDSSSAANYDIGCLHNQGTSYDGLTFIINGSSGSGLISVYGLVGK